MLRAPALYGVGDDCQEDDDGLIQNEPTSTRLPFILEKCKLVKYERSTGRFTSTDLGGIVS